MMRDQLRLHVLALDWSEVQTRGAVRKDDPKAGRKARRNAQENSTMPQKANSTTPSTYPRNHPINQRQEGSLTYVTVKIDTDTLLSSTRAWVEAYHPSTPGSDKPVPALLVALHACGSLTPDILRAFITACRADPEKARWVPRGALVVGCCYNMLRPEGQSSLIILFVSRSIYRLATQTSRCRRPCVRRRISFLHRPTCSSQRRSRQNGCVTSRATRKRVLHFVRSCGARCSRIACKHTGGIPKIRPRAQQVVHGLRKTIARREGWVA